MKVLNILLVVIFLLSIAVTPVLADEGELKAGDKRALSTGEEETYLGVIDGQQTWQVVFGDPVYIPGTETKYDLQWHFADGEYVAGANVFEATVSDKRVTIEYDSKKSTWKPDFKVGTGQKVSGSVTLLLFDPINSNYQQNTLVWDYGNGIKRYLRIIEGMLIEYYIIDSPLVGDIVIDNKVSKDADFTYHRPSSVWDAEGTLINITETVNHKVLIRQSDLVDAVYPITIDPETTFTTSSSDGYIKGYGWQVKAVAWIAARDSVNGDSMSGSSTNLYSGVQSYNGDAGDYAFRIYRTYVYFDTSGLPDGATVTAAVMKLYGTLVETEISAWEMQVQSGMDTYPRDPLLTGDFDITNYAGDGGSIVSGSMTAGSYASLTLNAVGRGWVNDTGMTKFMMASAENDIADTAPTTPVFVYRDNKWTFYSYEKGIGFRPELVVTYSATAPAITRDAASLIAKYSARLNATVDDDGGESCQVRYGYGTTTQGVFANYDTVTAWGAAEWDTGEHPYLDIGGLNANDEYFWRVQIKNAHSEVDSVEGSFFTLAAVSEPTDLRAIPANTEITLTWVKGDGSTRTRIRWSTTTYPTAIGEGFELYFDVGETVTLDSLTAGDTIFISAWGESDPDYSASYTTVVATTLAVGTQEGDSMETPTAFTNFFADPDYTRMENLEPIYSGINGVADAFGTPRNTVWMLGALLLLSIISVVAYIHLGFAAGSVLGAGGLIFLAGVGLIPTWMLAFMILYIITGWFMKQAEGK